MAADSFGNDLSAVGVPITGMAAFAPVVPANFISKSQLAMSPITLPAGYKKLGLYKVDGGPAPTRENEDPILFFQNGYTLAGNGTRKTQIALAEQNAAVLRLIEGVEPDENGVLEVSASLPDNQFILFVVTKYRNRMEKRQIGVASVTAVEPDKSEHGSVEGALVTFTWQEHAMFNNAPFWQWLGTPTSTEAAKTAWTVAIAGKPTGGSFSLILGGAATPPIAHNATPANITAALTGLSGVTGITGITTSGTDPYEVSLPSPSVLAVGAVDLTGGDSPTVTVA
ncbi:hypothetical protein [Lysinibacter sp. HNR]|uniref:hypothetical protein n=1 Tax=Lysinibacter sp. HNR TaxID=3031408 RepID=UPI002435B470|nr:hypothetical protein [Lysinibacter sp. HNR]WGD38475.1 hypothetical protein FrondiHNR_06080 [Lysinibacter sp. HNR]